MKKFVVYFVCGDEEENFFSNPFDTLVEAYKYAVKMNQRADCTEIYEIELVNRDRIIHLSSIK